jgi:hypothetical protein
VALTRARHSLWVGVSALKVGRSLACVWHQSGLGYLVSGPEPKTPEQLGDEAFLRRIQYKMLMRSPGEDEFINIFTKFAESKGLACSRELAAWFLEKYYRGTGKPKRRCHPRDVLSHAIDIMRFERRPLELTPEILDKAFHSNFVSDVEDN